MNREKVFGFGYAKEGGAPQMEEEQARAAYKDIFVKFVKSLFTRGTRTFDS